MSTQSSTIVNVRTSPKPTGYSAARESDLIWSLPVLHRQFLTTRLEPDQWFSLCAIDAHSDSMIVEFGQAMGRTLKSVADRAWMESDPPNCHIDSIDSRVSTFGYVETLIYVKAMDIALGFLRIKHRPFYPNFGNNLQVNSRLGYLNRLNTWCEQLEKIRASMRIDRERDVLPPLPPGASRDQESLHADICLIVSHQRHEASKDWETVLSVLDGVAFHIRFLCHYGGAEHIPRWKRLVKESFDYPEMKDLLENDDDMRKLNGKLGRWKQAFANAVAISPLLLITGRGMGQTLKISTALQVGGRLLSYGKPELILRVEELLWRCIIGIALRSWTSEAGLRHFLTSIEPMMRAWSNLKARSQGLADDGERGGKWIVYQGEDVWFRDAIAYMQKNPVQGLETRLRAQNMVWLTEGNDRWLAKSGYRADTVSLSTEQPRSSRLHRRRSCSPRRVLKLRPPARSSSIPPSTTLSPGAHANRAKAAFSRESICKLSRLLTYRVEKWGHDKYPGLWPNEPVMPLLAGIQESDCMSAGEITMGGVQPACERTQNTDEGCQEIASGSKDISSDDVLGRKQKRGHPPAEDDEAAEPITAMKKPRGDSGLSRSQIAIYSMPILVPCTGREAQFSYFPLISNEEKYRKMVNGWNTCVIRSRIESYHQNLRAGTHSMAKPDMILMLEFSHAMETPANILEMFGSHNILLFGIETLSVSWSLASLHKIGNLNAFRQVQDCQQSSMTTTLKPVPIHMSLQEIYEEGLNPEGQILTVSLPSGWHMSGDNPLYSTLASHIPAFEVTTCLLPENTFDPHYPCSAISFWMVSTKGAISHIHSNGAGVGTIFEVVCGCQLWYLFHRSGGIVNDSCIDEYLGDWTPGFVPDVKKWEAEVVVLEPGSVFCMQPDTHYAVVTLENSIVKGHRFYATSALQKTVSGWVHTCMLSYAITDALHFEFQEVPLRMMCYFSMIICDRGAELESYDIHVPSIDTRNGLLNLIALGNLCLFSSALSGCTVKEGSESSDKGKPSITAAIMAYLSVVEYASKHYRLVYLRPKEQDIETADDLRNVEMVSLSITDFVHTSAAHFARSLIYYAQRAIRRRKTLGQQESDLFDPETFKRDVKDAMIKFMNMELTDDFVEAYKSQKRKRLHHKPKFLVKANSVVLGDDALDEWRNITDFDPSEDGDKHDMNEGEVERDEDI